MQKVKVMIERPMYAEVEVEIPDNFIINGDLTSDALMELTDIGSLLYNNNYPKSSNFVNEDGSVTDLVIGIYNEKNESYWEM